MASFSLAANQLSPILVYGVAAVVADVFAVDAMSKVKNVKRYVTPERSI